MTLRRLENPLVIAVIILLAAGRWDYWQGWLFISLTILVTGVNFFVMRKSKDLTAERKNPGRGIKKWDKLLLGLNPLLYFGTLILCGLDAGRFGWSLQFKMFVYILGGILFLLGQATWLWAIRTNRFFSSVVRIQEDRNQNVCQEGPYKVIRHPGYFGRLIFTLATPILLGSLWGLIISGITVILLIVRTKLEDDLLKHQLPGYAKYIEKVKYRLVPGVW